MTETARRNIPEWKLRMKNRCSFRFFLEGVAVHVNILRNKKEEYFVSKHFVWCVIWQMLLKSGAHVDFLLRKFLKISILNEFSTKLIVFHKKVTTRES